MQTPLTAAPPGVSAPPAPKLVPPPAQPPKRSPWLLWVILAVVGAVIAWNLTRPAKIQQPAAKSFAGGIRTAGITKGTVERIMRLSGTTGAERAVSLVTPQLRGSRGGRGRDNATTPLASVAPPLVIQSNARNGSGGGGGASSASGSSGSGGVSSGGSSSSGGGSGDSSQNVSSTAGQNTGGGSSAFRSATSRVGSSGGSGTGSGAGTRPTSGSSTTSSASGPNGLGSTSTALQGTGTGGGGGGAGGGGGGGGAGASSDFGLVLEKAVLPGSTVRKGQTVASFDRVYMLNRLEDYQASVAQQDESVNKLRAELVIARRAYEQRLTTAKSDLDKAQLDVKTTPVLGRIEAEKVKLAAEEAQANYDQVLGEKKFVEIGYASQLRNAEIDLEQSRLELKRAQANADRMVLQSPMNGLAVMQPIFRGAEFGQVQAGDQLWPGMMFMQIVDPSSMVVNASVNQVDVESLRIGQKARVRFDAYPGLTMSARVHSIGAMTRGGGMRASYVKEIPVVLKIDGADNRVIPDLSVSAEIVVESEDGVTVAPAGAVFGDAKQAAIYVKSGEEWERRPVQLGVRSHLAVVVRSGLRPGDVVAMEVPPVNDSNAGKSS